MERDDRNMEELINRAQLGAEYNLGRSTVWHFLRRHEVPRFWSSAR